MAEIWAGDTRQTPASPLTLALAIAFIKSFLLFRVESWDFLYFPKFRRAQKKEMPF
jgi:hypothetical protein